jgi:hypothetical protein
MGNGPHIQTIWPDYWKTKQKNGKRKEALTVPDSCNNESNQSSTTTTTTLWSVTLSVSDSVHLFALQFSNFPFQCFNPLRFCDLKRNHFCSELIYNKLIFLLSQSRTLTWIPNPDLNRYNVLFSTLFATI